MEKSSIIFYMIGLGIISTMILLFNEVFHYKIILFAKKKKLFVYRLEQEEMDEIETENRTLFVIELAVIFFIGLFVFLNYYIVTIISLVVFVGLITYHLLFAKKLFFIFEIFKIREGDKQHERNLRKINANIIRKRK